MLSYSRWGLCRTKQRRIVFYTQVKTASYIHYHCNHRPRDVQVKDREGAFFYQIITEKDESVKIAQVQQLLVQSFISADLILSEVRKFKC